MRTAPAHKLITPFFTNQLKRRIAMLTKNNKPAFQYLRKLMVLPLLAVAMLLFSFTYLERSIAVIKKTIAVNSRNPILNNGTEDLSDAKTVALVARELNTVKTKPKVKQQQVINSLPAPEIKIQLPSLENLNQIVVTQLADTVPRLKKEPEIFTKVEKEASYPGDWSRYLMTNLNASVATEHGAPAGNYQAIIQFVVARDGSVSDIRCIKDPGFGIGQEAMRVIKLSGNWNPAEQNHRTVKAYRKQPITFSIQDVK
ncbi:MAG: energy transducer TonB [Niabella sp.]|nr:energy transducer TonB [Niabella sp.]